MPPSLGKYDFKLGRADIGPLGELCNWWYRGELCDPPIRVICALFNIDSALEF